MVVIVHEFSIFNGIGRCPWLGRREQGRESSVCPRYEMEQFSRADVSTAPIMLHQFKVSEQRAFGACGCNCLPPVTSEQTVDMKAAQRFQQGQTLPPGGQRFAARVCYVREEDRERHTGGRPTSRSSSLDGRKLGPRQASEENAAIALGEC